MSLDNQWFTEISEGSGTAFSLKIIRKLHEEQTPYQKIEVFETEKFGNLMTIDGCVMLSTRDNFLYHEMMSHPVLFTHPGPEKVVIIGGGDCGTLQQVLRHKNVKQVWQIDIDEKVTRLAEQYFPELCADNQDDRANLLFDDGIKWMANAASDSIDVIIVDSTDPIGPAEGLFTKSFYQDCHRALKHDGLLVQQSESPLIHAHILKSMRVAMLEAGYTDLATLHFPQCVYPTGWWSATMVSKSGKIGEFRRGDAENKPFSTHYYSADIHQAAFATPPFLKQDLE